MSGFKWKIVGIVAIAVLAVAVLGCFLVPLFVAIGRDMWQYALS